MSETTKLSMQVNVLLEQLKKAALAVIEFKDEDQAASQRAVKLAFREYIHSLSRLATSSTSISDDLCIPIELLQMVDLGAHPDEWFKAKLEELSVANAVAHGKAQSIEDFSLALRRELGLPAGFDLAPPGTPSPQEMGEEDAPIDIS